VFLYKLRNSQAPPSELVGMVFEYYQPIFKLRYDDFNKRSKDLETLQNISENYRSLDSFLADMAIEPIIDSVTDIGETDKEDEYLTLSTIHSAKGLEWHSVFVIHAVEGYFPSVRAAESLESLEEERRLMYVASTRAKQNLFVTYPMHMYNRIDGITLSKPSRFISEMSTDKAQGWLVEDEF
jgi:DNA helicase-2/ATP-dependent DNA helicase PcrA